MKKMTLDLKNISNFVSEKEFNYLINTFKRIFRR